MSGEISIRAIFSRLKGEGQQFESADSSLLAFFFHDFTGNIKIDIINPSRKHHFWYSVPEIEIYDYVEQDRNPIQEFMDALQSAERGRLMAKIHALQVNGFALLGTSLLTDTKSPQIKEIVVNGKVAVRLLLCRGPIRNDHEATLLFGAFERDRKYVPTNAISIAEMHREVVKSNPVNARRERK